MLDILGTSHINTFHEGWMSNLFYLCTKPFISNAKPKWAAHARVAVFHNLLRNYFWRKWDTLHSSKNKWAARVIVTWMFPARIFHLSSMSLTLISHKQPSERVYMWIFQQIKILTLQWELSSHQMGETQCAKSLRRQFVKWFCLLSIVSQINPTSKGCPYLALLWGKANFKVT